MKIIEVELKKIKGSIYPVRTEKDLNIEELASSIKENGLIYPIILRREKEGFRLICGQRRVLAVKQLGWKKIPAIIIEEVSNTKAAIQALVENLEHLDLSPLERARNYGYLITKFKLSRSELAKRLGKSRTEISNYLRLIDRLPKEILEGWDRGKISFGHARILLGVKGEHEKRNLYRKILRENLSIRQTEFWADRIKKDEELKSYEKKWDALEDELMANKEIRNLMGRRLSLRRGKGKEYLTIAFVSFKDLKKTLQVLSKAVIQTTGKE